MERYRLVFASMFVVGLLLWQADRYFEVKKNLTLYSEVYSEVSRRYVDDVEAGVMLRNGINAMLELLDPYTVLIDDGDDAVMDMMMTGTYTGVGIEVGARGNQLVIIAPMEGYSAFEKGVRAGDVIHSIDGVDVTGYAVQDLYNLLKGEVGTTVMVTLRRSGIEDPIDFLLTRQRVEMTNVAFAGWMDQARGVAYLSLSRFGYNATEEIRTALTAIKAEAPIQSLILDLRNNPGGLLDEAVRLVDQFVPPRQLVVKTVGRAEEDRNQYLTSEPVFFDGPLIVLQNGGSASSSEIVAGALQDLDRAVILGDRSFGKGLVQIVRPLSYNVSLKLTVSRYYTPSGRSIQSMQYLHDGRDASVMPDSLRTTFKTKNGRDVKDGLGIDPDVWLNEPATERLDLELRNEGYYFRFANEFRAKNEDYADERLSDAVYTQFRDWLVAENFTYQTRQMAQLADIRSSVPESEVQRYPEIWKQMEDELTRLRGQDIVRIEALIRAELHDEILSRYLGANALTRKRLESDPSIIEALELFNDTSRYAELLKGKP